jgi:hypothetical protein
MVRDNPALLGILSSSDGGPRVIDSSLEINGNSKLQSVGLNALSSVGWDVYITDSAMTTWSGLVHLESVGRFLELDLNPQLVDIGLPALRTVSGFAVCSNSELRTLSLPALGMGVSALIRDNPKLPACAVEQLFAQLSGCNCREWGNDSAATCP